MFVNVLMTELTHTGPSLHIPCTAGAHEGNEVNLLSCLCETMAVALWLSYWTSSQDHVDKSSNPTTASKEI